MQNQHIRTASRIAYLNATNEPAADTGSAGWTIHGTAIGADEVTNGAVDGEPTEVEWPSEVLAEAAGTLEDKPVIDVHSDDGDGSIEYPPPAEITVGKVERVGYDSDVGILYEATLADEELAQKIEAGILTVSPEIGFNAEEREDGPMRATEAAFFGLAVVSVGGSDAASAAAGPNEALAQATLSAVGIDALLSAPDDPNLDGTEGEVADSTDSESTTPAESGVDTTPDSDNMGDNPDDPSVAELLDRIDEKDERIATLEDEKEQLSTENETLTERNATLEEEIDEVKEGYAAVLADEDSPFTEEDLVERFDVATLRERFEDRFEDGFAATLEEPDVQSGAGGDGGDNSLDTSEEALEEARNLKARAETFEDIDPDHASTLKEQAAETVGADDFDAVLEVLE